MHRVSSTGSDLQDLTSTESGQKIYNVSRSRLLGLINWVHVFGTYLPIAWFIVMGVLICQVTTVLYELRFDLTKFWLNEVNSLKPGRIIITVSHKDSTLKYSDFIYKLTYKDGLLKK